MTSTTRKTPAMCRGFFVLERGESSRGFFVWAAENRKRHHSCDRPKGGITHTAHKSARVFRCDEGVGATRHEDQCPERFRSSAQIAHAPSAPLNAQVQRAVGVHPGLRRGGLSARRRSVGGLLLRASRPACGSG